MKRMYNWAAGAQEKFNYGMLLRRKWLRQQLAHLLMPDRQREVVFIAGVQRSGTNMVMDMLERSYVTDVFHERDNRAFDNYELRDLDTLRQLIARSKAPMVVFKALCESHKLGWLQSSLRPAKAIWVFRRYDHVVNSHIRKWTGMPQSIAEIASDSGATADWRGRGMSLQTREWVKRCYHTSLSNASACALFWYFRNILYFEQNLPRDSTVKLISYDQMLADPHTGSKDLFDFLGLDRKPATYGFVNNTTAPGSRDDLDIDPSIREACETLQMRLQQSL